MLAAAWLTKILGLARRRNTCQSCAVGLGMRSVPHWGLRVLPQPFYLVQLDTEALTEPAGSARWPLGIPRYFSVALSRVPAWQKASRV